MNSFLADFFKGTVDVAVESADPALFLTLLSRRKAGVYDVSQIDATTVRLSMYARDYRKIRSVAKKANCRLKILKKHGFCLFVRPLRKRYALWGGLVLLLASLFVLSSFVWTVSVEGANRLTDAKIRAVLSSLGVKPGARSDSIDPTEVKTKLLLALPDDLSWAAVNVRGSVANVQVVLRKKAPEAVYLKKTQPADVVAAKPGYILRVENLKGELVKGIGSTVVTGDKLISGLVHLITPGSKEFSGVTRLVHAEGRIWARTWQVTEAKMPAIALEKVYTGRTVEKKTFYFADYAFSLDFSQFGAGIPFMTCDKINIRSDLVLFDGPTLPFSVVTERYREYVLTQAEIPAAEAEARLKEQILASLLANADRGKVTSAEFSLTRTGDVYTLVCRSECEEQIGTTRALVFP